MWTRARGPTIGAATTSLSGTAAGGRGGNDVVAMTRRSTSDQGMLRVSPPETTRET